MRCLTLAICLAAATPVEAQPVPTPIAAPAPLSTTEARSVADELARKLEARFVYPETGKRYADALRTKAAAGGYDTAADRDALARMMTDDLQKVSPDGHLKVFTNTAAGQASSGSASSGPRPAHPPVIEQPGWIAPGIAFIRFNAFLGDDAEVESARKFMADHADAKTIIFDLRTHRGGGLNEMDVMLPWLYDRPTKLVSMATRKSVDDESGSLFGPAASLRIVPASPDFVTREHWVTPNADPRLRSAKVFLLTSPRTASAAEHFALAMKHTGRGTLIGTATAGANHFGGGEKIGENFSAFIPVGRTYDPETKKDWEGTGVLPDIETRPEDALAEALRRSGVPASDVARLSAEYMPSRSMERRQR